MDPDTTAEGGNVGVARSEVSGLADRHADDIAALHRVTSLDPGDPDERLGQLLEAGCKTLGVGRGYLLLRGATDLRVRVAAGPEDSGPRTGELVHDWRLEDSINRRATVATLGGPGAPVTGAPLGPGSLVACPVWVTGRVAGAVAFVDDSAREPFTTWQLALVDLVADGAARILEHEADIRAMVRLESQAQAVIDLMPDPVVRLQRDGQQLAEDTGEVIGAFDPTAAVRPAGTPADPATLERVQHAVAAALNTGRLQTEIYAAGPGEASARVEARFVPGDDDIVLCIVRDITERHRAELALAEQVAFEALVASISTRLISCSPQLLDDAIDVGLGEIASFFAADAAFIDELSPDGSTLRVSHHWTDRGIVPTRGRGERVDLAGFGWLTARFERTGHVFARGPGSYPKEATEQALVDAQDKAVLWVRLGYGGELVGVLGLTWRTSEPPESDDVLGLVRFAADAFLGALRRRSVALLAEGQAEVFELIARGAPVSTALLAAQSLLGRHTLGATVVVATVEAAGRLSLVTDAEPSPWSAWFAGLEPGLDNPFGQAVITGEPVLVANAMGDPRYRGDVLPDAAFKSATILPVRSPRNGRTLAVVGLLGLEPGAPSPRPAVRDSVLALVTVAVERSIDERRLAHQATHDPLTGVGNRAALLDRLTLALARARRSGRAVAVLFCDLDSFKAVNDRFGHDRGDRLLVEVAERIGAAVRPSDTVCRTGGDEFVIVCEDLTDPEMAHAIGERVRASIEGTPVDVGETHLEITVSVGVAVADLEVDDPDRLLRTADLAMYARKQGRAAARGSAEPTPPSPSSGGAAGSRHGDPGTDRFGLDLAESLEVGGIHLVHQPVVGRDGVIAGVEALVRWNHPVQGEVSPARILSAAVDHDLVGPLARWIRRAALGAHQRWTQESPAPAPVPVHVNLSAHELAMTDLVDHVLEDLEAVGLLPESLVLEVREQYLADAEARGSVERLGREGIVVLAEDAGGGGLALAELADLPVGGLKLGISMVSAIRDDDARGVEVARSIVLLAHGLGWRSLAVGVESDHQRAVLFGFGVESLQGHVVSPPLDIEDLLHWMVARPLA